MAANTNYKIALRGEYVSEEAIASAAFYPGHLVEFDGNGEVAKHDAAGTKALPMFALEDSLQGGTTADAYAHEDLVPLGIFTTGMRVNARIADGEHIEIGDLLCSNGDGCLREANNSGDGAEDCIAVAAEHIDLSASGAVETCAAVIIL